MVRLWRYGDVARMGIRGAWGSARHGPRCMACGMQDCGLCGFLRIAGGRLMRMGIRLCRPTAAPALVSAGVGLDMMAYDNV